MILRPYKLLFSVFDSLRALFVRVIQRKQWLALFVFLVVAHSSTFALNRFSVATGLWNSTGTWSATSGGGSGASVPVAGDVVTIEGGFTVTVGTGNGVGTPAACTTLIITNGILSFGTGGTVRQLK